MPEGDTVFRTARRLHQVFAGQPLSEAELRWGEASGACLVGARTIDVVSRGKHLLHRCEGGWTLHSHLRMDGSWRILPTKEAGPRRRDAHTVRAVLATSSWTALGVRLGMLDLVRTSAEDSLVGHLGPDVLGPDWDAELALSHVLADPARPLGSALLDQRNLAGIGTMYAAEALFLQRLHPWSPVGDLPTSAISAAIARAHRLLHANVAHAVQSTTGSRRRGEEVYVHARSGLPCRRCGAQVRVAMIGLPPQQRTMFYCPRCQGGLAPGDEGGAQRPLGSSLGGSRRGGAYEGRRR